MSKSEVDDGSKFEIINIVLLSLKNFKFLYRSSKFTQSSANITDKY